MIIKKSIFLVVGFSLILFFSGFNTADVFAQDIGSEGQRILNQYQTYKDTGKAPIPSKSQPSSSNIQSSSSNTPNSLFESVSISQDTLIGVGIFIFIIIIVVAVAASRGGSSQGEYAQGGYVSETRRSFSQQTKDGTLEYQEGTCASCERHSASFHFDHIDGNRSNNSQNNCQALCPNCHDAKTRGLT